MKGACTQEFEFTLLLCGVSELNDDILNALFEAGCDDATVSMQFGACCLEFCRESTDLMHAVLSAISDVYRAKLPGISVLQVDECNLVTQAEIARRCGRTRQMISLYISGARGAGGFPPPVCHISESTPLWRWCEVSCWLSANDIISPRQREEAEVIAAINNTLERFHQQCRNSQLVDCVTKSIQRACDWETC